MAHRLCVPCTNAFMAHCGKDQAGDASAEKKCPKPELVSLACQKLIERIVMFGEVPRAR